MLDQLERLETRGTPALLNSLRTAPQDLRLPIAEQLAGRASRDAAVLVQALSDEDWHVRWGAAHALGRAQVRAAVGALIERTTDEQARVARTAAWALGRIRDPGAVPALMVLLRSSNDRLSAAAAWALGHIGTAEALDSLAQSLETAGPKALRSISLALTDMGPEAASTLVGLLQTGTVDERTRAATILSRFGAEAARMILPLLASGMVRHRRAAAHILGTLRLPPDEVGGVGERKDGGSGPSLREQVRDALVSALWDDDLRVRLSAARSVGALGFQEARPELERLLPGGPEEVRVVANALAALGNPAAGAALVHRLESGEPPRLNEEAEAAIRRALVSMGLAEAPKRRDTSPVTRAQVPLKSDYYASVTPGLETVAWEEIAQRLPGASLTEFGDGHVIFRWKGSPQAGAILRSVRRLFQGGVRPAEIPLAKRLRKYRVKNLPASLEPTTAYAVARLANTGERDLFIDLSCGAATIALERALDGPARAIVAADIDLAALEAAAANITAGGQPVLLVRWDARQLPLPDHSVSAVAANLPYGRRSGSHQENLELYPSVVGEVDRVLRRSGIAVLVTAERRLLRAALSDHPALHVVSEQEIEAGGIRPAVFVMQKDEAKAPAVGEEPARDGRQKRAVP